MTDTRIDLDAYLARIGYQGPREVSLPALEALQFAHATSVPFENLSILCGEGIALDLGTLQQKIVKRRRGGYCFEQNGLALAALRQLGFEATGLIGRVRWMAPDDVASPLTHMLIRVDLDGESYIYDGGFGGIRATGILKLAPGLVQKTRHEDHRIMESDGAYTLQVDLGGSWANVYRFTLEPQSAADYEVSNWYTATHPASLFVNNLIVERPGEGVRRMIVNNSFTERQLGGAPQTRVLRSADELADLLETHFDLPVNRDEAAHLTRFLADHQAD